MQRFEPPQLETCCTAGSSGEALSAFASRELITVLWWRDCWVSFAFVFMKAANSIDEVMSSAEDYTPMHHCTLAFAIL